MDQSKRTGRHASVERLLELAKLDFGISTIAAVADLILESPQVLQNWARGRGVSKQGALKIERNLGWSAMYLRNGEGPARIKRKEDGTLPLRASTIVPPRLVRKVPIQGFLATGEDGGFVYIKANTGEGSIAAFTNGEHGRAHTVRHDRFEPRYRSGDHIVTAPMLTPIPGDDVVVFLKATKGQPDEYTVMRLMLIRDNDVELQDLKTHQPRTIRREQINAIEKVIGSYTDFARLPDDDDGDQSNAVHHQTVRARARRVPKSDLAAKRH